MSRGLLIVDVQTDFCEGGALAVAGGQEVARWTTELLMDRPGLYTHIFASQDWHNPLPDLNGGHFAPEGEDPNYVNTWPVHCVASTPGAAFHDDLLPAIGEQRRSGRLSIVRKGMGRPDYSAFQGEASSGCRALSLGVLIMRAEVTSLDIVGIATDHCVLASGRDALKRLHQRGKPGGLREVRVVTDLCAGVDQWASREGLRELETFGAALTQRRYL